MVPVNEKLRTFALVKEFLCHRMCCVRIRDFLKSRVGEIHVKQICFNQEVGVIAIVKSVHFKNTVARFSVHSKLWSFSIIHQLTLFWRQLMYYWKTIIILSELRMAQLCSACASKLEGIVLTTLGYLFVGH